MCLCRAAAAAFAVANTWSALGPSAPAFAATHIANVQSSSAADTNLEDRAKYRSKLQSVNTSLRAPGRRSSAPDRCCPFRYTLRPADRDRAGAFGLLCL